MKPTRHKKRWSQDELEYLEDSWGFVSLDTISKNLQRTKEAVRRKAWNLGLGPSRYADGLIYSPPQIAELLKKDVKDIYRFIEDGTLKGRKRKLINERVYQVHFDDLMAFLKDNPDKWDSRKVPPYTFGIEPDWMKEKRIKDMEIPKAHKKWTKNEERELIYYVNQGYEMRDIANILGRTLTSIYRRAQELRERGQLKPIKKMTYWSKEEINKMLELEKQGLTDKEIAYKLGRKRIHITDKRRMLRKQGLYESYKNKRRNIK